MVTPENQTDLTHLTLWKKRPFKTIADGRAFNYVTLSTPARDEQHNLGRYKSQQTNGRERSSA